jgi:hypothetical protein
MKRVWINQPSTLQPLHKYHGTSGLLDVATETFYFLYGDVVSMQIPLGVLSEGWNR